MEYKLLGNIFTIEDRAVVVNDLETLKQFFFQAHGEDKSEIKKHLSADFGSLVLGLKWDLAVIDDLLHKVKTMKIMELSIAYRPTYKDITRIGQAIKATWGEEIIFRTTYQPELIGGIVMAFNGKYVDLSLVKKLDDYLNLKSADYLKAIGV